MNQTEQTPLESQARPSSPAGSPSVLGKLVDIGAEWASVSLDIGKAALKQSAHTLESGAQMLESLSAKISRKGPEPK